MVHTLLSSEVRRLMSWLRDRAGSLSVMVAVSAPVLIGAMGLGTEVAYWYWHQRAMQNAADAAAIAAAMNGGTNYATEAKAVAARYGFSNGSGSIVVTATNPATATDCASSCYVVSVTDDVPLFLSQLVGFIGTTQVGGNGETLIAAQSVARRSSSTSYCMVALATSGATPGINTDGAPKADLQGCNIMSNTTATCNGHNLNATIGDAAGTNSGCGVTANSNVPPVTDPYSVLALNIPSNTCSSYAQEPTNKNGTPLPTSNQWSGALTLSGNTIICGDLQLTGDTTINAPGGAVLVIENGQLDTNGYTLQTSNNGSALTIVFSGTTGGSYTHAPTGDGTLNVNAPTSGAWSGVAIYQDPNLTTGVNISAAGNSPTWDISGLVYLPHSSVTFNGAVNKSSNGVACFVLMVDNVLVNGSGSIFANNTQCASAGLTGPTGGVRRGTLVN